MPRVRCEGTSTPRSVSSTSGQFSRSLDLADAGNTIYAYQGAVGSPKFLSALEFADGNSTFNGSQSGTGITASFKVPVVPSVAAIADHPRSAIELPN